VVDCFEFPGNKAERVLALASGEAGHAANHGV
jgi:hypothetical protein